MGAAILGPTVKGPVGIPTVVTSYSDYTSRFGSSFQSGSEVKSFLTSISAYNYFNNGGTSLLVTRITSGSFTSATSSVITGSDADVTSFTLKTLGQGTIMNSDSTETNGSLESGSADNLRWEITSFNTSSGTFNLLIRRGNDTTNQKVALETWTNLSLDPNSENYISRVIGDTYNTINTSETVPYVEINGTYPNKSRYVYVSQVTNTTNYFDNNGNAKSGLTGSLPAVGSGSFGGGVGEIIHGSDTYYENITGANNDRDWETYTYLDLLG